MATGRIDILWHRVVHLCVISLNILLQLTSISWSGWETYSIMTFTLDSILLSDTAVPQSPASNITGLADQFVESVPTTTPHLLFQQQQQTG